MSQNPTKLMGRLLFLPEALLRPFHVGESALRRISEDFPLLKHTGARTWARSLGHYQYRVEIECEGEWKESLQIVCR